MSKNSKKSRTRRRVRPRSRNHQNAQKHIQKMARVSALPLKDCRINADWQEQGYANILIARSREDGDLAMASFLVDLGCLGVKDAVADLQVTFNRYRKHGEVLRSFGDTTSIPVETAVAIIEQANAYASELGFEPCDDFEVASQIYRGTEADATTVVCGKDGKPHYASSADDSAATLIALREKLGEDGFGYDVNAMPSIRIEASQRFGPQKRA